MAQRPTAQRAVKRAKGTDRMQLRKAASEALTAKHSRYHETQADDYGYDFLKAHGKNPWAMGEAFKKLKSLSKRTGDKRLEKLLQLFADHPDFDERIEHMRKRAKSDGYL